MKWSSTSQKKILKYLILKKIKYFKFDFFIVYLFSFFSSILNALSAISIIPLVYILTNENDQFKEIPFFVKIFEKINIESKTHVLLVIFCTLFIFTSFLKAFNDYFIGKLRKKIIQSYLKNCLNKFFNSDWHFFYQTKISKISSAIYKDLEIVSGSVMAGLTIFSNVSIILILFFVPFIISYKVTIVLLLSSVILFIPFFFIKTLFSNLGKKRSIESEMFSNFFNNSLNLIKIIIVNFKEDKTAKDISDKYNELQDFYVKDKFYNSLSHESINILMILFVFLIFFSGNYYNLFISEIVALIYSLLRIIPYLTNLLIMNNSLASAQPSFDNIESILSNTNDIGKNWGNLEFKLNKEIILKDVNYNYPDGKIVLRNINIKIKKNSMICFFGPSGSGKSTLIDIIAGLNYPKSGQILFDDCHINNFSRESFSKNIGYLDSNNELFPMSIRENFLWIRKNLSDREMTEALKFSGSISFVEKLKNKIDTNVGDKGSFLSAGQKQRLCISRALVKDPQLIILDEPTSHLDEISEKIIMENLTKIKKEKTIIFTSHNKKLLSFSDEAYEVNEGSINRLK